MQLTDDFLDQAQAVIDNYFRSQRAAVLAARGNIDETIKGDNSPVTEIDKRLEEGLKAELTKFDAGIGLYGEEFGKEGNTDTFWLIDPIDGTENLIRGFDTVRHMVTLIDGGQPVYAYVARPITDQLYTARKDGGAYKNGEQIHISQRPLRRSWIELSAKYRNKTAMAIAAAIEAEGIAGFRTGLDFTAAAEGKFEGCLVYKSSGGDWDYAPRVLLMKEAGAKVANLGSDSYDYRNHDSLAIREEIFDVLMPVITKVMADEEART